MNLRQQTAALFDEQLTSWPLLKSNWRKLSAAQVRTFPFDGFSIRVQFNPKRITSSAAKVDPDSIGKRPCFLCQANRPAEQRSLEFGEDYEILCNPYPIFERHYTIVKTAHTPQMIDPEIGRMLDVSGELPGLVVFYNAPACGASAPDHMHFQAGSRGFMPIEKELNELVSRYGRTIRMQEGFRAVAIDDGLRRMILLESGGKEQIEQAFTHISGFMREKAGGKEPMLNILAWCDTTWQVLVFPREKHRPWQFFEQGEKNILLSPAAVDMGGTLITPLGKDFMKIDREDITDIFSQVTLRREGFDQLKGILEKRLNHGP
jgi:hypothetical protein